MAVAQRYRDFAEREARGHSSVYESWAVALSESPQALALIASLPPEKQQPNLVLAAARLHGADNVRAQHLAQWLTANWAAVRGTALGRRTQTNEAGRAAVLLPALTLFPGPLALIEVGASAGLCLYPDRFSYRYTNGPHLDPADGPSQVQLDCADTGAVPHPSRLPEVVHRAGVDLNPLDPADPDDCRWLETLVWPGQPQRVQRLRAALSIAAADPATLIAGDLNSHLAGLVHAAPAGATVVVFHSAVLGYLDSADRENFRRIITDLPCHWISNEAPTVFPSFLTALPPDADAPADRFVLAVDRIPVAFTGPHGQTLDWLTP